VCGDAAGGRSPSPIEQTLHSLVLEQVHPRLTKR
jgi:hypothetical protein